MDFWKNKEISQQSGNNYWEQQAEKANVQAQERLENRQRYGVELSDEEYAQINSLIADSDNYDEEAHHIGSAILFSKQLGIPVNEAYTNLKDYTDALYGTDQITSYRTGFEAIKDMFIIGNNGLQIGELGNKLKRAEADGDEELIKLYSEQIERLNKDNELRQDNAPRSWVTEALKTGAQTLPFSGQAALLGLFGNFITPGLGTVLAFGSSSSIASGQEYVDMRNEGVSPQTARIASEFSGGIQGLIEVSLGTTTEYLAAGAGKKLTETVAGNFAKKVSENFAKRFHYGPSGKLVVNFITNKLADSSGEAAEEALQQITSQVTNDIARSMDGLGFSDKTITERSKEIADAAVGGFVGAIVLGIPIDVLRTTADIKDYKNIKEQARTTPSGEMFYNNVKDNPVFAEVSEEKKKSIIEQVWKNAQNEAYEEETLRAKEIAEVNTADSNFEDIQTDEETGETNAQPVYRENGLLQTEDTITEDNGNIKKGTYRTGNTSTKEKNLYGYINYTIDEDNKTVTIDNFSMNNAREGLRAEFYDQFAEKFADYDINWDPILKAGKSIKEELIASNPNGKNNGLNYYSGADIADIQTRKNVAAQIKKNIIKMSDNEVAAAVTLLEAGAKRQNMSITDYVNSTFGGQIFGDIAEAEQQAQMQGATFQGKAGAMQWKQFGQQVRAVIYAGENADFSTFAHELAHVYQGQLQGDLKTEAEAAFNVQNGDWQNSTVVGKDGKTYSSAEAFAYGFQDWLKTGRAENEQMKNIFQKFAEFISRCINALKDHINLSPEIESVYNQLLSGDDSLLAKAEKAVAQQDNEYRQAQREAREQQKAEEKAEAEKQKQQAENNEAANSETTFDDDKRSEVVKENLTTPQPAPEENNIDSVVDSLNMDEAEKAEIKDILNDANSTLQEKSEAGLDAAGSAFNDDINGIPSDMFFQIIGEYGATQLDREEEVTTRIDNLNIAREMETAGKDTKTIRLATGWEKGVDGKWRYEISDLKNKFDLIDKVIDFEKRNPKYLEYSKKLWASLNEEGPELTTAEAQEFDVLADEANTYYDKRDVKLKDILDAPELYASYPELKNINVKFVNDSLNPTKASYVHAREMWTDAKADYIKINNIPNSINVKEYENILLHEIQHAIQEIEGFAEGGNVEQFREADKPTEMQENIMLLSDVPKEQLINYKEHEEWKDLKEYLPEVLERNIYGLGTLEQIMDRWISDVNNGVRSIDSIYNEIQNARKDFDRYHKINGYENEKSPIEKYQSLAGEVEARNVQSRQNMTTEERLNTLLSETEDVARDQQIILFQAAQMADQKEEIENIEAEQQIAAVRKQYEGTDQWLKAPNGKDTNLTEKQWLQVRTPNFKRWFGNWENNLNDKVEFTELDTSKVTYDYKNAESVRKWLEANLVGKDVTTENDGVTIYFRKKAAKESLKRKGEIQKDAYTVLEELIKNAHWWDFEENDGQEKHKYLQGQDIYFSLLKVGKDFYSVKIKTNVNKKSLSSVYKDHKVEKISVTPLYSSSRTEIYPGLDVTPTFTLRDIVDNVNVKYSKVLDENGEPLVIYHGSGQWFNEFNNGKEIQHSKAPKGSIFATDNLNAAISYVSYYGDTAPNSTKRVILDPNSPKHEKLSWGIYRHGGIYELFANIRNPYVVDYEGNLFKTEDGFYDVNEEVRWVLEHGDGKYDGLIIKNIKDYGLIDNKDIENAPSFTDIVGFNSNQFKSADQNNGNFDANNSNIQFQEAYHGTSASFDRFSNEHINEGEGSQSFGWGTYFTNSEEIARDYAIRQYDQKYGTETRENILKQRKEFLEKDLEDIKLYETPEAYNNYKQSEIDRLNNDIEKAAKEGKSITWKENLLNFVKESVSEDDRIKNYTSLKERIDQYSQEIETLEKELKDIELNGKDKKRNLYTVEIPDSKYLVWDKTVPKATRLRVMDRLYNKLINEDYKGAERELREELLPTFNSPTNGKELYQDVWTYLGSDKEASQFLYSIGIVGMDYPAGTNYGNGNDARNFVIFNDDDIKIIKQLQFQTEEELYRDAMMYDTWQDFMDAYQSDFNPAALEDPMYHSQVPSGADAQWYQTTWELAHNITPEESLNEEAVENQRQTEGMLPDALDSLFVSEMRGETGEFEDFMSKVAYYDKLDLNAPEWAQVADAEEAADRDRIEQIKELIDIVMSSGSMSRAINRIAAGGEITPGFKTRLISEMSDPQKSRDFRQLYAEVMDKEEFRVSDEDNAANIIQNKYDEVNKRYNLNMPDVDVSRMSPQQRKDISNNIDNIEIAQKLRDGTLKMDDQVSKYIDSLNKQIKDLQTQYKDLNKQILEETRLLADEEQKDLLKINEELIKAKAAYDKSNTEISRKIEKGIKISQKYQLKSQNLKHDYNELLRKYKDALATTKITGEVQRALDTQNKLGAALENIDKLEQERTSMQDIQKLRKNLVKRTMRRVKFDTVDYENARKIIAIQRIFEPNLIGGVNKWIGQNTPYLRGVISAVVTDKEYRNELTNYLRSKAKGSTAYTEFMQKWNELITAPTVDAAMAQFKKWDEKTIKRAALYLPKEDWIKELELKELEKEREESIDLDIELVERREPMRDENGNPIYINQYDENGKLIKNPDVQKQYYKTQWVVETSPEIKAMIKDAVGEDIFNNLLYRPFSDWTTEEMERLAKRVDDLYTEGRDILKARKQAQIERAAEIRKQIQDVVNNTGIVINDDDTPEEKEKKQKKIDEILGVSSELKGTNADKETGAKAKINRLLHGYNDANVMRVARILDGMDEGVNYNELYRREDDCYIEKTTSMNNRARNIQKVMKDNNITMEELAKTIEIAGRNFSIDEILFIAASNEDYVEDEVKLAKKLTGLDANDDWAATSRNAVMFGNMYSDTDSLAIKEQWQREDEEMQRKIENDELTPEEKQLLALGELDKKPGTTKYIAACKGRYAQVLAVANNLDEKYKALLKAISDDYATQYERMNEISIKEFNTPVHRVKCYVPLVRLESNGDTNVNQVKEDLLATMGAGAGKQWVNKGMTQRRVSMSPLFQKPVQMGLYKTWADSVERTEHFISYSGYVRELNRIYKSRDAQYTRQFIENRYGKGMLKYIDDFINEVANPNANKVREAGSELMHTLRGKTAPAYLAWKASAIIKQGLTSPWPFMQFVNPAEYFAASWKAVTSKGAIYDAIREKSVFMNNRVMDPMNDLIDEMAEKANQNKFDKAVNAFNKKGMAGLEWIDWVCVAPGWYACYTKKFAELNGKNQDVYEATKLRLQEENQLADFGTTAYKTPEQIEALAQKAMEDDVEKRAVQYADDCTRACQPSNRSVDIAPLFKNSSEAMKAYLQFQTSLNVIWQNLRYDLPYEAKKKQFNKIAGCIIGYALAGIFMNSVMDGLGDDDDKDGKKLDDILRNEIYYATTQFTDSVPMIGSELTNTMDKLITGKASYQTSGTDMTPTATRFFSILTNAKKGNWEKAADMFTEGVGMYLGLPVSGAKELKKLTGVGDGDGKLGLNLGEVYGILDVGE